MAKYGLVGKDIDFSFSKTFFTEKFEAEHRPHTYENYDLASISLLKNIINREPDLKGLNVTIPYKESVIPLLDRLHKTAKKIGAVNTIKIERNGKLIGYNTDHYGFAKALANLLPIKDKTALILGTGGASKAIAHVLDAMEFKYRYVSRIKRDDNFTYDELDKNIIGRHILIINCTPVGSQPKSHEFPFIPYQYLTADHLLFDLVYNPRQTEFMKMGFAKGARVTNGLKMLEYQAKKAWTIWKK